MGKSYLICWVCFVWKIFDNILIYLLLNYFYFFYHRLLSGKVIATRIKAWLRTTFRRATSSPNGEKQRRLEWLSKLNSERCCRNFTQQEQTKMSRNPGYAGDTPAHCTIARGPFGIFVQRDKPEKRVQPVIVSE